MKKRLSLLMLPFLFWLSTHATTSQDLIDFADKAISQNKITVDTFITTMQSIHEVQKAELQSSLEKWEISNAQTTLDQWNMMYPLTTHLYNIKAGSGKSITNASGQIYSFKKGVSLPWMSILWGEEEFYSFPQQNQFIEVQRSLSESGTILADTTFSKDHKSYRPTYFYAGGNTLQNVARRYSGDRITEINDPQTDLYYYIDLPTGELKDYSIDIHDKGSISGEEIYQAVSYSPLYFLASLDEGLQFCEKVAKFIGTDSSDKEYSAQQCSDAANGKFYKEMHPDILNYAADLYFK